MPLPILILKKNTGQVVTYTIKVLYY